MSTLGLSGPPTPAEGLWKGLFWPTIHNAQDADLAASRGFWICLALAFVSITVSSGSIAFSFGLNLTSYLDIASFFFYLLGAIGVRQESLAAASSMFATYLFGTVLYFWQSPIHFSFFRLIGTALLLTTLRATILIYQWKRDPLRQEDFTYGPSRLALTWSDRLANQMPSAVWPWGRALFYALAALFLPLECVTLITLIAHSLH